MDDRLLRDLLARLEWLEREALRYRKDATTGTDLVVNGRGVRLSPSLFSELATDPPAPAANHVVIYARDNGAGKSQLVARFATGAVQVVATEP